MTGEEKIIDIIERASKKQHRKQIDKTDKLFKIIISQQETIDEMICCMGYLLKEINRLKSKIEEDKNA